MFEIRFRSWLWDFQETVWDPPQLGGRERGTLVEALKCPARWMMLDGYLQIGCPLDIQLAGETHWVPIRNVHELIEINQARINPETSRQQSPVFIFPSGDDWGWVVVTGTCFIFQYIWNNHPNWLIFFRGVGQPPTRSSINRFPLFCLSSNDESSRVTSRSGRSTQNGSPQHHHLIKTVRRCLLLPPWKWVEIPRIVQMGKRHFYKGFSMGLIWMDSTIQTITICWYFLFSNIFRRSLVPLLFECIILTQKSLFIAGGIRIDQNGAAFFDGPLKCRRGEIL